MALLATLRPDGAAAAVVERLRARSSAEVLALDGLDGAGVHDLVVSCLGGEPPSELLDALTKAQGVPLLVEEMLASMVQRGVLAPDASGWRYRSTASTVVPASVEASVRERLAELALGQRRILEAAALLGGEFDPHHLVAGLAVPSDEVDEAMRAAEQAGLLAPDSPTGRPRFAHALVRDAVLHAGSNLDLARTASRLLDAVLIPVAGLPVDGELGATLAVVAGEPARASALYEEAGRQAVHLGLPSAAAAAFQRAVDALPDGQPTLRLQEQLLSALASAGDATQALRVGASVQRQLAASGASDDRRRAAIVAMARASANAGRWQDALDVLVALAPESRSPASHALEATVLLALNRFDDAEHAATRALGDPDVGAEVVCEAAEVLGRLARRSDLEEARRWFDHAAGTAELHGLGLWRARAIHELATIEQLRTCGVTGLIEAREVAIAASAPGLLSAVEFHIAALHGARFEHDEALAAARRCLDTARRLGADHQEAWAWDLIAQAHAINGDRERARAAADEATRLAPDDPEITGVAWGTGCGLAALIADDLDVALARWTDAIGALRALPSPTPLPPWYLWPLLATVHDVEGDGGIRARGETDVTGLRIATGPDGLWHLADAVAAGRQGDAERAGRAVVAADTCFALCPAFAGYVHLGHRIAAEAAIADGWGEPGRWLAEATAWARPRGLAGLERACVALSRRAGVRQRRRGRGDAEVPEELARLGITSREVDVLRLVATGCTNNQIAERLYLSLRTVKGHVESLLAKTGTTNRTQLAALVVPSPP